MSIVSDEVSHKLHRVRPLHRDVVELRYFADYGHGFLGLFRALFEGNLDEVINDPGPPFVDKAHIPMIRKTLLRMAKDSPFRKNIPKKYAKDLEGLKPYPSHNDFLFSDEDIK